MEKQIIIKFQLLKNNLEILKKNLIKIFIKNFNLKKKTILDLKNNKIDLKFNQYAEWDSLKHASILIDLEKKFKIKVNSTNLNKFISFKSIINFLKKNR